MMSTGTSANGAWESMVVPPAPALRPYVRRLVAYAERSPAIVRRHELPSGTVPLIVGVDAGIDVYAPGRNDRPPRRLNSFVAGLHESSALTVHDGVWSGVQVDLTPLGARRLMGVPMHEVLNRDVPLRDALGRDGDMLEERVNDAADWASRIAVVEGFLLTRFARGPSPRRQVLWAWGVLDACDGRVPISELIRETGWSARYLAVRFRDEVGVTPKLYAQMLRFRRAVTLLDAGEPGDLARLAAACGYADQSHLSREVRRFSGLSPTRLRARRIEEGSAGIAQGAQVTFLHDESPPSG